MQNNFTKKRFSSKFYIFRENLLKPITILKIVSPVILGIVFTTIFAYLAVNFSYFSKLVHKTEDVPGEVQRSLIIVDYKEIENGTEEFAKILAENESLYLLRKVTSVHFAILNFDGIADEVKLDINSRIKKINSESITYKFSYNDVEDVCSEAQKEAASRGVIFATGDIILRSLYLCNFSNLYYTGFKIEASEEVKGVELIDFNLFISDFFKHITNARSTQG